MINRERLVTTFLSLVRIDSPSGQEQAIGEHLSEVLRDLGLQPEFDETGNLLAYWPVGSGEPLLLSAHMDTVGTDTGIQPVIRDGIIYSDGTTILGSDDKSGIAVILEVLHVLQERDLRHPPLQIVISVGEELGLFGARHLDTGRLLAKAGIVLDAGGPTGHFVISAPSQDSMIFTVHGRTAHAGSEPEKGINAIRVAAEAIARLPLGRIDFETTSNVGIIEGGTARNIVPDQVRVVAEARSRDSEKLGALTAAMVQAFQDAAARHDARVDADVTRSYNAYRLDESEPILLTISAAARKLGHEVMLRNSGGGTDGNIYNNAGIPTVVLSTGMAEVHTPNEHIAIADMVASGEVLLEAIQQLAS